VSIGQIRTTNGYGRVDLDSGSNLVRGHDALADWTEVPAAHSWFSLVGPEETLFTIQGKENVGGGLWTATLDGLYDGPDVAEAEYVIHKDFTPRLGLPLFTPGDVQRSQIHNRAMWVLEQVIPAGAALIASLDVPTLNLPKPGLFAKVTTLDGVDVLQWFLLQAGAPATAADTATSDDPTTRWRQVG
jgi:hypothetical protein